MKRSELSGATLITDGGYRVTLPASSTGAGSITAVQWASPPVRAPRATDREDRLLGTAAVSIEVEGNLVATADDPIVLELPRGNATRPEGNVLEACGWWDVDLDAWSTGTREGKGRNGGGI